MTVTNTTISGNSAGGFRTVGGMGGGIFNTGRLTLTNVTIAQNNAFDSLNPAMGGGIATQGSGTTTLRNVILASNAIVTRLAPPLGTTTFVRSENCAGSGSATSLGDDLSSDATCPFTAAGDLQNTDPQLGPLLNNGGMTPTHALLPGSPAIDAGTNAGCPSTDQRGVARPQGTRCDIGAYEAILSACTAQTPVGVSVVPGGPVQLRATFTATTTTPTPPNRLRGLRFGPAPRRR